MLFQKEFQLVLTIMVSKDFHETYSEILWWQTTKQLILGHEWSHCGLQNPIIFRFDDSKSLSQVERAYMIQKLWDKNKCFFVNVHAYKNKRMMRLIYLTVNYPRVNNDENRELLPWNATSIYRLNMAWFDMLNVTLSNKTKPANEIYLF